MQCGRYLAHCDNDFHQWKPSNIPVGWFTPGILSSEFVVIQEVDSVVGGTSCDSWTFERIRRHNTTMLLIISTPSFLDTMFWLIYYTFIHISFRHSLNLCILITGSLFKSWQRGGTHLVLLLFRPAPEESHCLSTTGISMNISSWYHTITMIVDITIQHLTTSHFGHHPGKHWPSGH